MISPLLLGQEIFTAVLGSYLHPSCLQPTSVISCEEVWMCQNNIVLTSGLKVSCCVITFITQMFLLKFFKNISEFNLTFMKSLNFKYTKFILSIVNLCPQRCIYPIYNCHENTISFMQIIRSLKHNMQLINADDNGAIGKMTFITWCWCFTAH